ncbi:MAG: hypothetical protein ACP5PX_05020 [Candidatus Hadarchaeum sp.]|uniref:hypothetical protein n=1 Tax=Candidatus Hadarchaeum sp. TaxID=2883567 RepID=UPI003D11A3CE
MVEVMEMMRDGSPDWKKVLLLATALFLVVTLILAPAASAAKDSEKPNNGHDKGGVDDNNQKKDKKNKEADNSPENVVPPENLIDDNLDDPEISDNNASGLVDNNLVQPDNTSEQNENVFDLWPDSQEDGIQDQPQDNDNQNSLSDSDDGCSAEEQPASQPAEEQPASQPAEEQPNNSPSYQTSFNSPSQQDISEKESETSYFDAQLPSESQVGFENQPDKVNVVPQEPNELQSGQTVDAIRQDNVEDTQSTKTVFETSPELSSVSAGIALSKELFVLSFGFGSVLFVKLAQIKIQQKYLFQLLNLQATISHSFTPARVRLEKFYLAHLRFGKIKCKAGFTKEEALAFLSECQRLTVSLGRRYY